MTKSANSALREIIGIVSRNKDAAADHHAALAEILCVAVLAVQATEGTLPTLFYHQKKLTPREVAERFPI